MITLYKNRILTIVASLTLLTSCGDFLNIEPMNDVVLENFWNQKSDATSALTGCYEQLASEQSLMRMALWGELRSDNLTAGSNVPWELEQIVKENMLPTNSYCKWEAFYQTINRCNIVCHYAPKVQAIDPNYNEAEMKTNVAEAVAIRSLCYFYLIRTFRDVPFTRQPSIDDSQPYQIPATPFEQVLDSIIYDLEQVKDDAVRRNMTFENEYAYRNTSLITRPAIYAMLADMYLWKGEWDKCIERGQYVLDYKKTQYEELLRYEGDNIALFDVNGDKIPLLRETPNNKIDMGAVYTSVFGNGNSFESIFELYYNVRQGATNNFVHDFYSYIDNNKVKSGRLSVPTEFYGKLPNESSEVFEKTDCRAYEYIDAKSSSSTHIIAKYARQSMKLILTEKTATITSDMRSTNYANWIVYRMTDVMLMMAEAYVAKGEYEKAFELVNVVNSRANGKNDASGPLVAKKAEYTATQETMYDLVLAERQRELMFEGKRWFDLVRKARREGNTRKLSTIVVKKQTTNKNLIQIRLADMNSIYYPYFRDELKVNPYLKQNPAYTNGVEDEVSKN